MDESMPFRMLGLHFYLVTAKKKKLPQLNQIKTYTTKQRIIVRLGNYYYYF